MPSTDDAVEDDIDMQLICLASNDIALGIGVVGGGVVVVTLQIEGIVLTRQEFQGSAQQECWRITPVAMQMLLLVVTLLGDAKQLENEVREYSMVLSSNVA